MKIAYRKVSGILLLGVACLVAGCKSLPFPGFKKPALRSDCGWVEIPYNFRCDFYVQFEEAGTRTLVDGPRDGHPTREAP